MRKDITVLTLILLISLPSVCAKGDIQVLSDIAPNIEIEVLSDTQVQLTNHNLAVGYAVDVYKNGDFQPEPYSLTEDDLLGLGLLANKTKIISLPPSSPTDLFELNIYARTLPAGHPRAEFSKKVAWKNLEAAFKGIINNGLSAVGITTGSLDTTGYISELFKAAGILDKIAEGDIDGALQDFSIWLASDVAKLTIITVAQAKLGVVLSAADASFIGGMITVVLSFPTVYDVWFTDTELYHNILLLHTGEAPPVYLFKSNGGGAEPELCLKDWIPTFDIGDTWRFFYDVTNRSTNPLFNVSLEALLYGPQGTLVEHSSSGGGFDIVWNDGYTYPEYWDFDPYPNPFCRGAVGLFQTYYPFTISSMGHQYTGGLYRLETLLKSYYGTETLGSDTHWIKILDGQIPSSPSHVIGEVVGDNIVISWRPPQDTYDIFLYGVRRFDNPNRTGDVRVFTVTVPERMEPSENLTKVAPYLLDETAQTGVTYYYDVRITDWDNLHSEWSNLLGPIIIGTIIEPPVASIQSISAVPGPMPAVQGRDTLTFIGSGDDGDDLGELPEIRTYRWTSDLGKINGDGELYNGANASFSLSASDLRAGTHTISLTVQDNEWHWSEAVTDLLTINQAEPAEGHDVAVELYVSQANLIHLPTEPVTGEIWASNLGDYSESGTLLVQLKDSSGSVLDWEDYTFSSLSQGQSTGHHSFSLNPGGYQGAATVQAQVTVEQDSDLSNNQASTPVYFSINQDPTGSFDGYEKILLVYLEPITLRNHEFEVRYPEFLVDNEYFDLNQGEYIGLSFVVFQYFGIENNKYRINLWWKDNPSLYNFSTEILVIPSGGAATFNISPANGTWVNINKDVEILGLPGGWFSSVTWQNNKLAVTVHAPYGSGTTSIKKWCHMYTPGAVGVKTDAFSWLTLQTVSSPPETSIISGPEGIISTEDIIFVWSGSDDTTPTAQLQYACRLEPVFSSFSTDTEKIYDGLEDGEYTFFVKARDLGGTEDLTPASQSFTIATNRMPTMPINWFPLSGQPGLSLTPTLVGSEFSDPDNGDTFAKSRFQIRSDTGSYDSPQWDSGELSPGTINVQTTQQLEFDSTYWWRCRYQDDNGSWSPWSNETRFRTEINPSLASDFNGDCKIDFLDFTILANQWQLEALSWDVATDGGDGIVNFRDWAIFADGWQNTTDMEDMAVFVEQWLKRGAYSADITPHGGDGIVDIKDLTVLVDHWLETVCQTIFDPSGIVWVDINDPGVFGHEAFNGQMSKYETTNDQYCQFLNAALATGDITVDANIVYGANGSNGGADFVDQVYFDLSYDTNNWKYSQIIYSGGVFSVRSRDGYYMGNHPVVEVSWYGATAFCNYYGWRLPTEWQWQAVADYDGSHTYGCGTSIDHSKTNYYRDNPLNLSSSPYTSPVNHYPSFGYGMNDMAGNVWEWTDSCYYVDCDPDYRVLRGGGWIYPGSQCVVSGRGSQLPDQLEPQHWIPCVSLSLLEAMPLTGERSLFL